MPRFPLRRAEPSLLVLTLTAALALAIPTAVSAQVAWTAAGGAWINPQTSGIPTRRGAALLVGADGPVGTHTRWAAEVVGGRTDFYIGPQELHTLIGTAVVGLQLPMNQGPTGFGVLLAGGFYVEDDVSETDPDFASSARGHGTVAAGLRIDQELNDRLGFTLLARDYVTGVFERTVDREEGGRLTHHFVVMAGLRF